MSDKAQPTPGPWRAPDDGYSRGHVFGVGLDGHDFVLANCKSSMTFRTAATRETDFANARLIAAAPDLLAALRGVQFAGSRFRCPDCQGQPVTGHAKSCAVGAAIAKATGA